MQAASNKTVLTGGAGIAVAPIIVWALGLFGVEVPAEVAAGIAGILALVVSYFVPAKSGRYVTAPGDEYEVMADDDGTEVDGEHPDGDYPQNIYGDDPNAPVDAEAAVPEDKEN